jgi:hypothetical protein
MTVDELAIRAYVKSTPFAVETVAAGLDAETRRIIASDATPASEALDPIEITLVDGEVHGTEDDLADVVNEIVTEQVARFMAGRR